MGLNVSVDFSLPLKTLEQPLRNSIQELRRGYQSVSECLEQSLAESEARGAELADCRRQLAEARRSLSECERQLAERTRGEAELNGKFATLKKHLEGKQAEWTQTSERTSALQIESAQAKDRLQVQLEQSQAARQQIESLEAERQQWLAELAELRTQLGPMTASAAEAARLGAELASAESELFRLRQQLSDSVRETELARQSEQQQSLIAAFDGQRAAWHEELSELRTQLPPLLQNAGETARLAGQLEAAQAELARIREQGSGDFAIALENETASYRQQIEQWDAEREIWHTELSELRSQIGTLTAAAVEAATLKGQLAAVEAESQRLREQLETGKSEGDWQAQCEAYREQIEETQSERDAWRSELGSLRTQLEKLAASALDGSRIREELTAAREEVSRLHRQLSTCATDATALAELESSRARVTSLEAERLAWREELGQMREQVQLLTEGVGNTEQVSPQLAEIQQELLRLREVAATPVGDEQTAVQLASYGRQIEAMEVERALWGEGLGQIRSQLESLVSSSEQAAQLRDRLVAAEADLAASREQPAAVPAAPDTSEQLAAEQALREQLEGELDALRLRGAELSEALNEQKQIAAAERDQWSEELRQLRRALERQTEFLAQRLALPTPGAAAVVPDGPPSTKNNSRSPAGTRQNDAVVGTVLEQFEQLQKNKVRKLANSG
jgi:chromosome segregation ATPase